MDAVALHPWPEDPVPPDVPAVAFAVLADHGSRVVWGEGSPRAPLLIVLDNPGAREDGGGEPYVCGTRITLRQAAAEAGLSDEDLYVTYLLKRRPRRAYDRDAARAAYLPLLERQIRERKAAAMICMGNTVLQALFGPEADVKTLRNRPLMRGTTPAIATYHPLAARRRPHLFGLLVADLARAAPYAGH